MGVFFLLKNEIFSLKLFFQCVVFQQKKAFVVSIFILKNLSIIENKKTFLRNHHF